MTKTRRQTKANAKRGCDLSITNFDEGDEDLVYDNKSKFVPQWCFRWLICGQSGSGKTILALNCIAKMLHFDTITLVVKHPNQSKLKKLIDGITMAGLGDELQIFTTVDELPEVESFDKTKQNLILVDDFINDDQSRFVDYAIRGRHHGISMIYLSQSYTKVPRILRLQCNYFSFFEANRKEMRIIYDDLCGDIDDISIFRRMYTDATCYDYGFLMVDKVSRRKEMKYRKGFGTCIHTGETLD
jgi:hypothetical protein